MIEAPPTINVDPMTLLDVLAKQRNAALNAAAQAEAAVMTLQARNAELEAENKALRDQLPKEAAEAATGEPTKD